MIVKAKDARKSVQEIRRKFDFKSGDLESFEGVIDIDVRRALDNYKCAINRYDNADLSNPRIENVYFLERQITYIALQLALAKARIREGVDPSLDYTSFESILKLVNGVKVEY